MTPSRQSFPWGETIVPGLTLVFGLSYFFQTRGAPRVAMYWPLIIAVIAALFWLAVVFQFIIGPARVRTAENRTAENRTAKEESAPAPMKRPALILMATMGYLVLVTRIGFTMANLLFMLTVFRGLGSRAWGRNVAVALCIAGFLYFALVFVMKLSLPQLELGPLRI
ncbi:MAG: tripartite tricarboxylate transporter TctB family protein [Desulfobacterales bacterium]|nr:tripartite tricarboxylate transporter TctB family protein [Desulfobacterales bacterium]